MKNNKSAKFVAAASLEWEEVSAGVSRKILGYDAHLMMVHVRFKKGAVGAVHSHSHRQVTLVHSGKFVVSIGNEKKVLGMGDSFFVEPEVPHSVSAQEDGELIDVFTPARYDFLS